MTTHRLTRWALTAWLAMALAGCCLVARGEKPSLKLKRAADGTVTLAPDLPAGTPYEWAEFGSGGTQTWGICTWIQAGRPKAATYWFAYRLDGDIGPDPKPEPDPKPDPKPQPDPLPVPDVKVTVVYLVHESSDSDPRTAAVRDAKAWKDALDAKGIKYLIADDDSLVQKLPNVVAKARTNGLPSVVIVYRDQTAVARPLPALPAEMLKMVEGLK